MMKYLIPVVFIFNYFVSIGQVNPETIIAQHKEMLNSENDTMKYQGYIGLATQFNFVDGQQDSVLYFAGKALEIATELDVLNWKNTANYYHGLYHFNYTQDFEKAIFYYEITKEGLIEADDKRRLSTIYNAIGGCKSGLGDLEGAMKDYMEVYAIAKEHKDYTTLTNTLSNTSVLYTQMKDKKKAIETLKEALKYNKLDTSPDKGYSYLNAALNLLDSYVDVDSLAEADKLIDEIEPVADSMNYSIALDRLLIQKMHVLEKTNQFDELDKVTEEAYFKIKNTQTHNQNFVSIAYKYANSQLKKGNKSVASQVIKEIEDQTDQTSILFQLNKYESLADLNRQIGYYKQALLYSDLYHAAKDSIANVEKSAKLEELLKQYEVAKKEALIQESALEKLKLEKKNSILIALIMGLIGLGSILYLLYNRRRRKEQEEIHQIEQKMLSLQMNPHFIFNTISSIQNFLFDANDAEKAIHHLSTFASLMRQILENSREKFIPLEDEIEFLTNYLNLQKLRFDDMFDYEFQIDPDIDVEHILIPPLLTQPFVENAIEHGRIYEIPDGKMILKISEVNKCICIDIVDNGIGINKSQANSQNQTIEKKSLSISITKERLDLLSKLMKNKFSLQINENGKSEGTHVRLNIPSIYL